MNAHIKTIAARRESLGLSISEAARRAGMLRPNWSAIESGARGAGIDVIERMAEAVDLRIELRPISRAKSA